MSISTMKQALEACGDGVVASTHRVFPEWLSNPLTKRLKQIHKAKIQNLEEQIKNLEALLGEATWNYSKLKHKEWVGLTNEEAWKCWNWEDFQGTWKSMEAKLKEKNNRHPDA